MPLPSGAKTHSHVGSRTRVLPRPPDQPSAGARSGLTCQAAEFVRTKLAQAPLAVAVGEGLRARVPEPREVQQLSPPRRRPAGHDPGLLAAPSRPVRRGEKPRPSCRDSAPPRRDRASGPARGTGPRPRGGASGAGRACRGSADSPGFTSFLPFSHLGRAEAGPVWVVSSDNFPTQPTGMPPDA